MANNLLPMEPINTSKLFFPNRLYLFMLNYNSLQLFTLLQNMMLENSLRKRITSIYFK